MRNFTFGVRTYFPVQFQGVLRCKCRFLATSQGFMRITLPFWSLDCCWGKELQVRRVQKLQLWRKKIWYPPSSNQLCVQLYLLQFCHRNMMVRFCSIPTIFSKVFFFNPLQQAPTASGKTETLLVIILNRRLSLAARTSFPRRSHQRMKRICTSSKNLWQKGMVSSTDTTIRFIGCEFNFAVSLDWNKDARRILLVKHANQR